VLLTERDIYHFREGSYVRAYDKLGAHTTGAGAAVATQFAVWAPNAEAVSVIGDFNGWRPGAHPLSARADSSGIWEGRLPGVGKGALYKYHVRSRRGTSAEKSDPYAFYAEVPPRTASVVWELEYPWQDQEWLTRRAAANALAAPWSIYEVHLGSWRRVPEDGNRPLSYREFAHQLADYVCELGFTHVELLPLMEHPFYGSWGYQVTGYFAPSSRYGSPQDFMYLIEHLHQRGIGVILDWVPSHFPADEHGLARFDGTHLYEHADPRQGFHPEWHSSIFNYGRAEVRNFLISSALFWLDVYHLDGLRVDGVASMLYLDYARPAGQWIPNRFGGRENLEAVEFLKQLNLAVYRDHAGTQTIAEESTAWPMVSRPVYLGGLGFGLKWNMGWMHDTLAYFARDPVHRSYHHDEITFSMIYAYSENYVLPISHDEVVHGKGSLLHKMAGDEWRQFAGLRSLLAYMWAHPGKQLLFMGCEFGQSAEWSEQDGLQWQSLADPRHSGVQQLVKDLNAVYGEHPALWQQDSVPAGFEWIDANDRSGNVLSFLRYGADGSVLACVANFAAMPHYDYQIGLPSAGSWTEVINTDADVYGGSGVGNMGVLTATKKEWHGRPASAAITIPPMAVLWLAPSPRQGS
jgi:1,4-alpha-glucan branching enzyme